MNKLDTALEVIARGRGKASKSGAWFAADEAAKIAGVAVHKDCDSNYPDWPRLIEDVKTACGESILIVTRHATLVAWLVAHGISGKVIEQATAEDVAGMDVFGVLPMWLAAEANSVTEVSMPQLPLGARAKVNGGDYTVQEMDQWGATMRRFVVRKG